MAITSERRPRFWAWRTELERSRDRLWVGLLSVIMTCLVFASLLVWQALRPLPIHYINGAVGTSWPGQVPETVVEDFAVRVVTLMGNMNPTTARRVYELSGRYLTPALATRISIQAKTDLEAIESQRLGMSFVQSDVTLVEKTSTPPAWGLIIRGTRTAWTGQQIVSQDPVEYTVRVVRVPGTDLNPYGLAVESIQFKKAAAEARRG